jgi:hypothetical protein
MPEQVLSDEVDLNVRDFGARGDGVTKDTAGLQAAIDACAAAGGGRVVVPAGRYLTGTIYLKSHVELHLRAGSQLVGSTDRADYNPDDAFAEDPPTPTEEATAAHLIVARHQEDISITGQGTIDGNSAGFLLPLPPELAPVGYRHKPASRPVNGWRPGKMVFIFRCRRVAVRDVAMVNSPYWTLTFFDCEDVQVRGLLIDNPADTRNGDGIDVVSSRNVTISDCVIRGGDDCIVVRTRNNLLDDDPACEDVVVSNCVLSTPCQAIRVGVADGAVRRCRFSNIVVRDSAVGIDIVCWWSSAVAHGTLVEQLDFSDITIDATIPITIRSGPGASRPAAIRDVTFSRIRAAARAGSPWLGTAAVPIERVRLLDSEFAISGGTSNETLLDVPTRVDERSGGATLSGMRDGPALPCALYGTHLRDCAFDNVRVRWADDISSVWRDGLFLDDADSTLFRDVTLRQPRSDSGAAIRLRQCAGAVFDGCRADPGTTTFAQLQDSPADAPAVRAIGNDLLDAVRAFDSDTPLVEVANLGLGGAG